MSQEKQARIFLVVVDETEEMSVALHYAARRARNSGGRVALLHVIPPGELQQWGAIEELMKQEQREEAEQLLQRLAKEVVDISGTMPTLYIREGQASEQLMKLIQEEPSISILVLAAGTGRGGPGPLINYVVGQMSGSLRIPVTVVPGALSDTQLDAIT
ncbi:MULTISPECIES: universal stress protein [unclassified Azospirillum]|uniref:universal stress protein n=1 Tax=unclassified Azospirillum TaxID=2630922 RepID=UPI000B751372|nr:MULTISPECIES: universal stress protein [unclassified Azospirillum]SNS60294.1 Nucleotide-binding universal stress protein, UspA family [Azospirillum sp. RU38E]SNS79751.1 Nucleotide-binding universal stress protein, UspA family [Azospirillum sp. RU37A]